MPSEEIYKQQAAEHALDLIESGMALGLGTGSTATYMVRGLAQRLADGRLRDIVAVPTSNVTADLARRLGIPLVSLHERPVLDLALDGADEIDPQLNLIKGLGGALLHEKIVAAAARTFVVMGSSSKLVSVIGERTPLPVEVVAFGLPLCARMLRDLGCEPVLRRADDGQPFQTDEGHVILDCRFRAIEDPSALSIAIHRIPGVVEHGLFINMATRGIIAGPAGVESIRPTSSVASP